MAYKSEYLVHWTGKDICTDVVALTSSTRIQYIQRLESSLRTGLWMNRVTDGLSSRNAVGDPGVVLTFSNPMTCFTEVRLTQSVEHTRKYGLLGLGFSREFLLARDGLPVIYLRNGQRDFYTSLLYQIWDYLPKDKQPGLGFKLFVGLCKPAP